MGRLLSSPFLNAHIHGLDVLSVYPFFLDHTIPAAVDHVSANFLGEKCILFSLARYVPQIQLSTSHHASLLIKRSSRVTRNNIFEST